MTMLNTGTELPCVFHCQGERLVGIVSKPAAPDRTGVVIVVGGPQYRAGSHRQFTLLARQLAESNIASIRFDYRGMGDSEGNSRDFENVEEDIRAAIDQLIATVPDLQNIVLWGLCDAATASACYSRQDPRVSGLVLLNPWVHSEAAEAQARLRYYYTDRLFTAAFWHKLLKLQINVALSGAQLLAYFRKRKASSPSVTDFTNRMLESLSQFQGDVLVLLSGQDMTAQKFIALTRSHPDWQALCKQPNMKNQTLAEANHTFSSPAWRNQIAAWTIEWLAKKPGR